jgi:predicted MPP superfamily phosphohydrolase
MLDFTHRISYNDCMGFIFTFFLIVICTTFYATSKIIYVAFLEDLFDTEKGKKFAKIAIILTGQSFWLLILSRFYPSFKMLDCLFYFSFVSFLYMFALILLAKIVDIFKPLDMHKMVVGAIIISCTITSYGFINEYFPVITRYNLKSEKDVKVKIALITDLHMGDLGMKPYILQKTLDIIEQEKPDFLVIGGDIIEGSISNFDKFKDIFVNDKTKKYAVLGNHDYYRKNYMDGKIALEQANIDVLMDEYKGAGKNLIIIGREDRTNRKRKTVKDIMKGIDKSKFLLLIDHNPKFFDEAVAEEVDLQLSGHTHNGQIFPFTLIVKTMYEKSYGLLEKGKSKLITSSGLNGWGPPIKIGSRVEIAIVEIN